MDFYEISREKIKIIKPKLKDESISSYLRNIKKISKELFNSDKPTVTYFLDFESIKKYVLTLPSLASQKNMVTSILVLVKSYNVEENLIINYATFHKELSKSQEESYIDNVKSEREEKNWITGIDIKNKMTKIKKEIDSIKKINRKYIDLYQQYLVLNLYTLLPPLRNDYVLVRIITDSNENLDEDYNYINLDTKQLLLYKYKTNKHYGLKTIDIPSDLIKIIKDWEKVKKEFYDNKLKHNFMLLNTTNLTCMKHNTLTKFINKIFAPKKVSSTILRKVYLSERYPVVHSYAEQLQDSFIMGHSINTQKMVYSKKL